jgi:hypothetical protein
MGLGSLFRSMISRLTRRGGTTILARDFGLTAAQAASVVRAHQGSVELARADLQRLRAEGFHRPENSHVSGARLSREG